MQKRFTVCALTMLSIACGAALAARLTPAQRIDRAPVDYVNDAVEK
jgi:hypothetical protein